ncbi:MAG TPA: hypothetical protein DCF68_21965 [Cyanothece sp. UBA12306]|nr:hypothetical protein [Cyanothece sp. UBA12306]
MNYKNYKKLVLLKKTLIILILCFAFSIVSVHQAIASIKKITEASGQILYKSKQSWKDQAGNAWQVVLFKRIKDNETQKINLRLVGFPGVTEFNHPQELTIKVRDDLILTAPDVFVNNAQSPSPNVGQYDFNSLVDQLEISNFWLLTLPVKGDQQTQIRIPYFILKQWEEIMLK